MSQPLLRFITCGSVDDGKSTFIGRLLYESRCVFEDQLRALEADSKRFGTQGSRLDFALLVDGLQAEREQGITIDVAYRFFATPRRRFIVADTPGHEQYTRNMATGASTAELAVILIDARKGVLPQTRRHTRIAAMMGIRHVLLAVNKMDLMGYEQAVFDAIVDEYAPFAAACGITSMRPFPISALEGDNLITAGSGMPWYDGPTVMDYLETVEVGGPPSMDAFRMPVQWINRPGPDFRGFSGRVCAGAVHPGDRVRVLPSGVETHVDAIVAFDGNRPRAEAGDSITLTLADQVDVSRGDVIASVASPPEVSDQFEAHLLWMADSALIPGRTYVLKTQSKEVRARVTTIKCRVDIGSDARLAARTLALNDIGVVNLSTTQPIPFESYAGNRTLGSFILVDPMSYETVAAGMIDFALRRAANVHWQALDVTRERRAQLMGQRPCCVWFTGLSGSGKSTIANRLEKRLAAEGRHTYLLDGDNVRHGLNRDLGFTEADRAENIRRVAEVARLMVDAGLIVLVSFISPYRAERRFARSLFGEGDFIEVFVDTPIEECERRDVKGLYAKARSGQLPNFTGIESPYEPPEAAEIHLSTLRQSVDESADEVFSRLPDMDLVRVAAGALTGFVVGMTGVGGGALMTPILLLLFGTAPLTAVGTDLWFAAITKLAVSGLHLRSRVIDWPIVGRLWMGSLPASLLTLTWMASRPADPGVVVLVRGTIGVAVCVSAASLLFQSRLRPQNGDSPRVTGTVPAVRKWDGALTVATGALLGALVTLTSVGAGALGAVLLYHLYPRRLTPVRLVATDVAHAIPLALCAGLGHLAISQVDGALLRDLLVGSVPAALVGASLSGRLPHTVLRRALGAVLLVVGLLMLGDALR